MVDMSIAGAPSGTDAVSLLRSGRSKNSDDDSNGFFDALNNSGSGKTATGTGDATDDDAVGAADPTKDSDLPDAQVTGSIVATSSTDLDAVTMPATAATATTIANAALFPKALTATPTSTTLPSSATLLSGKDASASATSPAATDTTDATVADAMASLGVAPAADTDLSPVISTAATPAAPTDGKTALPALPTTGVIPPLPSTPVSAQQPAASATPDVPVQPDVGTAVQTAPQPAADMMQQLAAIVGDNTSAQPAVDGKAAPAATTGKTQSASSGDDDTKTDSDATKKEDATADAADSNLSGAVTDALSLLNAAAPMAAQVQAQAQTAPGILAGAGQAVPSAGKSQTSVSTGSAATITLPRGKASAAVTGTLDTDSATAASDDKATAMPTGLAALAAGVSGGTKSATTATTDDNSTSTFRIARADGKAVDMSVSKNADDTTQADVQTATGTGTETVTVLDSRRYLGLADGSNSALVANTLAGNKEWSSAMRAGPTAATAVVSNTSKVVNTLKIQMNPEKLGTVTATMRLAGDSLSVDLKVQSAEAYRQLSSDQGPMIDSLRAQGYTVDHITVTYAPQATTTADTSSQQQNSQAGFQGQQQSGASQGQGGEAQSRRQNSGQRTADQDGIWGTQNVGSDDSAAGNTQRTRSSGVYL